MGCPSPMPIKDIVGNMKNTRKEILELTIRKYLKFNQEIKKSPLIVRLRNTRNTNPQYSVQEILGIQSDNQGNVEYLIKISKESRQLIKTAKLLS